MGFAGSPSSPPPPNNGTAFTVPPPPTTTIRPRDTADGSPRVDGQSAQVCGGRRVCGGPWGPKSSAGGPETPRQVRRCTFVGRCFRCCQERRWTHPKRSIGMAVHRRRRGVRPPWTPPADQSEQCVSRRRRVETRSTVVDARVIVEGDDHRQSKARVTTAGKGEMYNRGNLVGLLLVHKKLAPRPHPPPPPPPTPHDPHPRTASFSPALPHMARITRPSPLLPQGWSGPSCRTPCPIGPNGSPCSGDRCADGYCLCGGSRCGAACQLSGYQCDRLLCPEGTAGKDCAFVCPVAGGRICAGHGQCDNKVCARSPSTLSIAP